MHDQPLFLDYDLPNHLIAQTPANPRDTSRLLVADRASQTLDDRRFRELPEILSPGDLLVANDSKVIPARISARRETGGQVELLLLEDLGDGQWTALARPLGRLRPGEALVLGSANHADSNARVRFIERRGSTAVVELDSKIVLPEFGRAPLPPYIRQELSDPSQYQTVYAREAGSAAAPTAGLHFTPALLERCRACGIGIEYVTLHVGIDTFRPLGDGDPSEHRMHSEWFSVAPHTWDIVERAKTEGRRVVSVGTTTTRVLETLADPDRTESGLTGRTAMYIRPPYDFRVVDAQITNFHLPRTTLLLIIGAFAGEALLRKAYAHAIEHEYRFYSFGDAMLIV